MVNSLLHFQNVDAFTALTTVSNLVDRLYKASGTQRYPALSCADLLLHVPTASDGESIGLVVHSLQRYWLTNRDFTSVHLELLVRKSV